MSFTSPTPNLQHLKNISAADFDYNLPDERIANFPLPNRDDSKLLIFRANAISELHFSQLSDELTSGFRLIFNNTKVIKARLFFQRPTGAIIEVFCLEPVMPTDPATAFASNQPVIWRCLVGNYKKWRDPFLESRINSPTGQFRLRAELLEKETETALIRLSWDDSSRICAEVFELAGKVPLPPYIHRDAIPADTLTYQTVYSKIVGSVAAPTAGLHFTPQLISALKEKNIRMHEISLNIGAGTFKPVKSDTIGEHDMHAERFTVPLDLLLDMLTSTRTNVAVGTTSVRALESLYWMGVKIAGSVHFKSDFLELNQWEAYELRQDVPLQDSLESLIGFARANAMTEINASTRLLILPGYQFRIFDGLITNFHQPRSTLLMLVSAFIGASVARVYAYALENGFRFLSYGDSSLLWRNSGLQNS